ncbi:MAG: hypothetical protein J6866_07705, partial [Victivallales bacterium]|nr:hypothetical protein [Victivallales bacterium]
LSTGITARTEPRPPACLSTGHDGGEGSRRPTKPRRAFHRHIFRTEPPFFRISAVKCLKMPADHLTFQEKSLLFISAIFGVNLKNPL